MFPGPPPVFSPTATRSTGARFQVQAGHPHPLSVHSGAAELRVYQRLDGEAGRLDHTEPLLGPAGCRRAAQEVVKYYRSFLQTRGHRGQTELGCHQCRAGGNTD